MNEPAQLQDAVTGATDIATPNIATANVAIPQPEMRVRAWHLVLAGLIAAGLAFPFLKYFEDAFPRQNLTVEMTNRIRANADDPIAWAKDRQNYWESLSRNSMLNLGIFGLCLGSCFGLVLSLNQGGTYQRIARNWIYATAAGVVAGIAAGLLSATVAYALQNAKGIDVAIRSCAIHAAGWIVPGLTCGMLLGLISGRRPFVLLAFGGLLGGLAAALLYEAMAALVFQLDRTDLPVPEGSGNKFLFLAVAGLLILLGPWTAAVLPSKRVPASAG